MSVCVQDEEIEYECVVTCKVRRTDETDSQRIDETDSQRIDDMTSLGSREDLTPAQIDQLMAVIANMDTVKNVSFSGEEARSPPPSDGEIRDKAALLKSSGRLGLHRKIINTILFLSYKFI